VGGGDPEHQDGNGRQSVQRLGREPVRVDPRGVEDEGRGESLPLQSIRGDGRGRVWQDVGGRGQSAEEGVDEARLAGVGPAKDQDTQGLVGAGGGIGLRLRQVATGAWGRRGWSPLGQGQTAAVGLDGLVAHLADELLEQPAVRSDKAESRPAAQRSQPSLSTALTGLRRPAGRHGGGRAGALRCAFGGSAHGPQVRRWLKGDLTGDLGAQVPAGRSAIRSPWGRVSSSRAAPSG
jgi:hypothetical protein